MLPKLDSPLILDVGCGSGGPTLEITRMSAGRVIGIDINDDSLRELARKIKTKGLSQQILAVNGSLSAMCFRKQSFNLVWAEGVIFIVGFERGLKELRLFIKPGGFLVVHEMAWLRPDPPSDVQDYWKAFYSGIRTVPEYLEVIPGCGYDILGHIALPEDAWWNMYYGPMERRIQELRTKYAEDPSALAVLERQQRDVDLYKIHQKWYGSAFFVLQNR